LAGKDVKFAVTFTGTGTIKEGTINFISDNMRLRFSIFVLLTILVASCNLNRREDAMKLNNTLAGINDSLFFYGKNWNEELAVAVNTRNFSQLPDQRLRMEAYIDKNISRVGAMKDIGGSEVLKKTELEFLAFEKQLIQSKFSIFEHFTDSTSDAMLTEAYKSLLQYTGKEQEYLARLSKLQDEYAEKNDFPKPVRP